MAKPLPVLFLKISDSPKQLNMNPLTSVTYSLFQATEDSSVQLRLKAILFFGILDRREHCSGLMYPYHGKLKVNKRRCMHILFVFCRTPIFSHRLPMQQEK